MADNQDPNAITNDAKEKMIRKALEIHSPHVSLSNRELFGLCGRCHHEMAELGIEFVRKFWRGHVLVVIHDAVDIRINLRMKDKPH